MSDERRVVITGLGLVTPVGEDRDSSWQSLLDGVSGAAPVSHFDPPEDLSVRFACEVNDFEPEDFSDEERARIDRIAATRYGLSPFEASKLRGEAEQLEAEAPDTVRFTREIKDAVPYEERIKVIEALWQVALADGERDQSEDALLRLVSSLLGVNDRDSALARQRVGG